MHYIGTICDTLLTFGIGQNWDNTGAAQDDVILVEKLECYLSEIKNIKGLSFHPKEWNQNGWTISAQSNGVQNC